MTSSRHFRRFPRATALSLALLAACSGCVTGRGGWGLPTELHEGPVGGPIEVRLNGRGPYKFGLDTGQSMPLLLSPPLAERLSLPVVQQIPASDGNSAHAVTVDLVQVREVQLGRARVRDALGLVMDMSANARPDLQGTVGFPLFREFLLTLDYPNDRVIVLEGELPPANQFDVLDYRLENELPVVPISIGGRAVSALLDSGSQAELLLPLKMAGELPLVDPPRPAGKMATLFAELDIYEARLAGDVRIGGHVIERPVLKFTEHFTDANLGRGVLHDFRVTFDQRHQRVRFERRP
jgi:predicted aspartyl protease